MAEIELDGKRAFYTTGGKSWEDGLPLLVFVHCAGGNQSMWILQSRALAHHGWNVAAVDLPGHGYSEDVEGTATLEDYASWVGRFAGALDAGPAVLAGHSMGAGVCLTLAAARPEQISGLIMIATRAHTEVNEGLLRDTAENPARATAFITAFSHSQRSHLGSAPTPGNWLLGSAQALLNGCSGEVLHRDFVASHQWDGMAYAHKVRCPALMITGEQDRMTPAAQGRKLAEAIPGAACTEIPAVGHFVMIEAPRVVLKVMQDFLAGLPAAANQSASTG
ncbi:MAG: alpha/beta hydrolase [SAR324 cluster bacterium]|nr:alpha/beta hydrolase [SAR324 cluster bacterium]